MRARGFRPSSSPICSLPIASSDAPSTMPDELPGVWTWSMRLDPVVLLQRDGVEAAVLAHHRERRLEAGERLDGRAGADELVVVEHDVVVDVEHRDDASSRSGPRPARPRRAPASGRRRRRRRRGVKPSTVAIRSAPMPCGTKRRVVVGLRVHRPGAAVGAHRHARHRLDAAGEDEVLPAGGDLLGGDVDGLQARGAEAVELDARDGVRQAGLDRGGLGDVRALVADRRHAAEHDVVDPVRIKAAVAASSLVHQPDHEVDRLGRVQRAVALALPARGADRVEYECFSRCHGLVLRSDVRTSSLRQTFVHERKFVATWSQNDRVRRSQAERSAATREALLDAAIDCLIDEGYASTTTSARRRAGRASRAARTCTTSRRAPRWSRRRSSSSPSAGWGSCARRPRRSRTGRTARSPASTCCGRTTRARSTRARWTSGPTRAPTTSCASS